MNSLVDNFTSGLLSTDLSDHLPIFQITISLTQNTTKKKTKHRKITNKTLDLLNQKLECEKWEQIYGEENPQHAYTSFYNTLFNTFDKNIPLVNNTNSYHKASQTPWITKGILTCKRIKNKLYKKYIDDPTEVNEKACKRFRNRFNGIKRMAKKLYYRDKLNELKGNLRHVEINK